MQSSEALDGPNHVDIHSLAGLSQGAQLTPRACVVGVFVGGVMCFSNMYFGLQTGWITAGSLQSTILGFGCFKLLRPWLTRSFDPLENVALQTVAVATATMPLAGGFVGIIPAMAMLQPQYGGPFLFSAWQLCKWSLSLAFFGVFVAVPLRHQTILVEKLRFPSGTATAQIIRVLHGQTGDGARTAASARTSEGDREMEPLVASTRRSDSLGDDSEIAQVCASETSSTTATMESTEWAVLACSFAVSGGLTIAAHFMPILKNLPVMTWLGWPAATAYFWSLQPSLSYVGQGIIMGPGTTFSMLLGALLGWAWLGPQAARSGLVSAEDGGVKGWLMWLSLAIMLAESLTALFVLGIRSARSFFSQMAGAGFPADPDPAPSSQQVPREWWITGLVASALLCVCVVSPMFSMPWYEPTIAVVFSTLVSVLAVRALGETDLNPVSGVGKLSQLLFAMVAPGNVAANLVAGAISEGAAMSAGDMMQDLKCGHILGASPRAQFFGQLIGTVASVGFSVAAWMLYSSQYTITDSDPRLGPDDVADFPAPTAAIWLDMAMVVNGGAVANGVLPVCIVAAILVGFLPILDAWLPPANCSRRFLPSGIALAIGMYVTPNWTLPRVAGGALHLAWNHYAKRNAQRYMLVLASGFVLGEGIVAVLTAVLKSVGIGPASCIGCPEIAIGGFCGGCYSNGTLQS